MRFSIQLFVLFSFFLFSFFEWEEVMHILCGNYLFKILFIYYKSEKHGEIGKCYQFLSESLLDTDLFFFFFFFSSRHGLFSP